LIKREDITVAEKMQSFISAEFMYFGYLGYDYGTGSFCCGEYHG